MFPGYVWNDVGNEVGRIGNYRTPILHTLSAGSIEASEGQNGIWHKKWNIQIYFPSFPVLYPGVCSYFPEVIIIIAQSPPWLSKSERMTLIRVTLQRLVPIITPSTALWCLNNAMVTLMWLDMGNWARNATSYWQHWTKIHTSKHQRHSFV